MSPSIKKNSRRDTAILAEKNRETKKRERETETYENIHTLNYTHINYFWYLIQLAAYVNIPYVQLQCIN